MNSEYPKLLPEEVKPGCGVGQGGNACRYITIGPDGWRCARAEPAIKKLLDDRGDGMTARRSPTEAYPGCQLHVVAE